MPKIAVCMPAMDEVCVPTMMSLMALQSYLIRVPVYADEENEVNFYIERNSLLVGSRQNLTQRAIDAGNDWILMLDSDMTFPPNIIHELAKHGLPLVACNYVKRATPTVPVTRSFDDKFVRTDLDSTGLEKVKFTGFGVLLIHAEIFRKLDKPWFDTIWMKDDNGNVEIMGEDVFFFEKLRHFLGIDLYIDHDQSQFVTHVGQFEFHNLLAKTVAEELSDDDPLKEKLYGETKNTK